MRDSGAATIVSREPAHPDVVLGSVALLDERTIERAVAAAGSSQRAWQADAGARSDALNAWAAAIEHNRDVLVSLVVREVGKPIAEARGEVDRGIRILRYYAQAAYDAQGETYPPTRGERLEVEHRPLGTVLILAPWNFPVAIPLWKIAPALAYGNVVFFRPSGAAALTAARLVDLARPHFPAGVLTFAPSEVSLVQRLLDDERIAGVSFTGSTAVGRQVVAAVTRRGGSVQAEMGGQNPSIVLEDADLELAASTIADAAMGYAGQKCTATSRVIALREVAEPLLERLTAELRSLSVGDPQDEATRVGPVITSEARERIGSAVDAATARGARVLSGASAPEREGWFYEPTLLAVDDPADPFAQDETFGPAASFLVANSREEAAKLANATRYGLSAAIFGTDSAAALAFGRELDVGLVRVNASTAGVDFYVPFGGNRDSSFGPREQGRAAREFFTKTRTIFVRS